VEGLLHVSEMTGGDESKSPEDMVVVGQMVKVKVLRVEPEDRKIGLSLEEIGEPPAPGTVPEPKAIVPSDDDSDDPYAEAAPPAPAPPVEEAPAEAEASAPAEPAAEEPAASEDAPAAEEKPAEE
ncbi:MAG: S1 RNA-binding domain-containing protein, partial [Planctomycetota bacterium]